MALKSMTGFGVGSARAKGVRVTVELSSVNRKQLDVSLRLPSSLTGFESRLQKVVQEQLSRGRVTGTILVEMPEGVSEVSIDQKHAAAVVETLRASAKRLKLTDDLSASMLLKIPGLLTVQAAEQNPEELFQYMEKALKAALKKLITMRSLEGKALASDILSRLTLLETLLENIKAFAPTVLAKHRKKLLKGLEASGLTNLSSDERVLKEIAMFGEKSDITEEITRLTSHIKQFRSRLRLAEPVGRELDFLVQEFLREINTIGSKANNLEITQQVVAFKTELERIREQIQNVE
ncbi:MAG: YicC family protein [Kiritimatiellaceae bacterium]|nr:YicC family protein [Kiritimatiellaceae bacterium]